MKKTLALAAVLLGSAVLSSVLAQGTVRWGNSFTGVTQSRFYGPDSANMQLRRSGNTATGLPQGATVYGGALLEGSGYTTAMFFDNDQTPVAVNSTGFRTGAGAGVINGLLTSTDPTRPPGTMPMVQFRVWQNRPGEVVTSWAQAMANPTIPQGASDPFALAALGGTLGATIFPVPDTVGIRSFNLTVVPEPSLIALGALGLGALLLRRRK